jgi:uncharacterized protein YecE (DUF72 family)
MHWIGTSGFQYPEWKGTFYPQDLSAAKMLAYYAERLTSTEINYSFRRIPSRETLTKWCAATPANFAFSFKAPQRITHFAKLVDCGETLAFFADALRIMNDNLGVVLFQLPPQFKCDLVRLREFLPILPADMKSAFEFRDESWFNDEVFTALQKHNVALCIAENEELATPTVVTADFGYLRLRREDYINADLKRWAKFVESQKNWRN